MTGAFFVAFLKEKPFFATKKEYLAPKLPFISVLIPFKNEEKYIQSLINKLKKQSLPSSFFEIIFIDDHSTDASAEVVQSNIRHENNFSLLSRAGRTPSKKEALLAGIREAKGEWIVTTDADCKHPRKWLETLFSFCQEKEPDMVIAPVTMPGFHFFTQLQALEFLSLTASTAGATLLKHPIMCNGANLAYKKAIFETFADALNKKEVSGDDVFLLHNFKRKGKKIKYLKSPDALVKTYPEENLKAFFKQRLRWSSKSKNYKDRDTIFVALVVLLTNLLTAGLCIAGIFRIISPLKLVFLLGLRILPEFLLLLAADIFFNQNKKTALYYFPTLLFYPFYIIIVGICGIFHKRKK